MWHEWERRYLSIVFGWKNISDLDVERKVQCIGGHYGYLQTLYVGDRTGWAAERLNNRYS
jgi:hypothetical protein